MTVVDLLRKSIAETEASLAAQYAALAELEAGPNAAQSPRPASLIGRDLKSVKQAAAMFSFTERTIRKATPRNNCFTLRLASNAGRWCNSILDGRRRR
jgi:hypothetical protein